MSCKKIIEHDMKGKNNMVDQDRIDSLFNNYRSEIMAKSPKSLAIWRREYIPAGRPLSYDNQASQRR